MNDRDIMQQALDSYDKHEPLAVVMETLRDRLAHCDRCGKRLGGEGDIHTCTPPGLNLDPTPISGWGQQSIGMGIPSQPEQEPDPIGDAQDRMIAEMAAQPEQKLVSMRMPKAGDKVICLEDESLATVVSLTAGGSPDIVFSDGSRGTYLLREFAELFGYATPPAAAHMTEFEEAVAAVDNTLHYAIDHWQDRALKAEAKLAQPEQEPYGWVQPNPSFNSGVFNLGSACPSGWVGSAIDVYTTPPAQPAPVQEGWKLVPVVATREIEDAIGKARNLKASEIWEDALAATPPAAQRKPLTDGKIQAIHDTYYRRMGPQEFARAIEAAHGIK
jgi:hypothetical protein